MAISGKFEADFADFNAAVQAAETKLVSFEAGGNKVTSALQKMETSLSGKKLIQDASLMAEAVERVREKGDLTAAELQRVGAQAQAAADKMRAMGIDVPPGIAKIAAEAKNAETAHGGLASTVRGLATDFLAMFTARAAFNFVKDIVDDASALMDLSQQTHISVEELQLLAGGMSEFGVDADTLGKGLFKLSRGIAGGDESVAHGLAVMGMSLKDVEGLNGKDLFLKIEGGLATLQGGLRDSTAADLFGGKLGAAMAGASEGIQGALEKWQALNHVASTESVQAMDEFGESIARAEKNLSSIAANMIGPVAQGFNVLNDAADKGASKWAIAWAMSKDTIQTWQSGITVTGNLTTLLNDLNKKTEDHAGKTKTVAAAHREVETAVDTRTQAEQFMAALEANAAGALTTQQLANLAHLKSIGELNQKNAEGIGVHAGQFAKYQADQAAALKVTEQATQDAAKAQSEWAAIDKLFFTQSLKNFKELETEQKRVLGLRNQAVVEGNTAIMAAQADLLDATKKMTLDSTTYQLDKIQVVADAQKRAFQGSVQQRVSYNASVQALADEQKAALIRTDLEGDVSTRAHYEKLAAAANAAYTRALQSSDQYTAAGIENLRKQAAVAGTTLDNWATVADAALKKTGNAADDATNKLKQTTGAIDASTKALQTFSVASAYSTGDLAARAASQGGMIAKDYYGNDYVYIPGQNAAPTGHRAGGGPVSAGSSYLVGERGPELYTPGANGFITPNGGGGIAPGAIVINLYGTPAELVEKVKAVVTRQVLQGAKV